MEKTITMIDDIDEESFTHYAINNEEQAKINNYLKALDVGTRKRQNVNYVRINVEIVYFPKDKKLEQSKGP